MNIPGAPPGERARRVIDIAFGRDGSLYVLQIAEPLFNLGAARLIRVSPGGTRTTIAVPGLVGPGGLAIAKDITRAAGQRDEDGGLPRHGVTEKYTEIFLGSV